MRVIVIGGGAAGMMSAIAAASNGATVELFEKNEKLGKKIFITGKGRCNVTNDCEPDDFFSNVVSNSKFLYSAYYGFDNNMVMDFFENNGCPLKVERGNRVFPQSDHSSDIIRSLADRLKKENVKVNLNCKIKDLMINESRVTGVILENGKKIDADRVIIATGGVSYPLTGSTGDGHKILKGCGHNLVECKPALVPFEVDDNWCAELQGLALKNVNIRLFSRVLPDELTTIPKKEKVLYEGFGEMLFTHFGISGPLIISASSYYVKKNYNDKVTLEIDLKPALTEEQLDKRILRDFEDNQNKSFKNGIAGLLPSRMIPIVIELCGIDSERPVHSITREERLKLINILKHLRVTVNGTRPFSEAIVTQGGISIKDVNPSTMESKLIEGLYITGELLDLDALTGGFNLQIAWSTGYLAGLSASTN